MMPADAGVQTKMADGPSYDNLMLVPAGEMALLPKHPANSSPAPA